MVQRTIIVMLATMALLLAMAAPVAAAHQHLHCLTTPNEKVHAIARGVTNVASHRAFSNFHMNVHVGVFVVGNNPLTLDPDTTMPFTCPPSPPSP